MSKCFFIIIFMFLPSFVFCEMNQGATSSTTKQDVHTSSSFGLPPGSNMDITFLIVERSNESGDLNKFSINRETSDENEVLQDFSIIISTIAENSDVGVLQGVLKLGDDLWTFTSENIIRLGAGRLIVSTKIRVKDGNKGQTNLVSKEPYQSIKVLSNREQLVIEFIEVGVKIEAEPVIGPDGTISAKMKMSISEVLRESNKEKRTSVPVVSTRDVDTFIDLKPGELEILAELSVAKQTSIKTEIPYLRKIPILGKWFFSSNNKTIVQTKLYIVGGVSPADPAALAAFHELMQQNIEEIEKMNKYR